MEVKASTPPSSQTSPPSSCKLRPLYLILLLPPTLAYITYLTLPRPILSPIIPTSSGPIQGHLSYSRNSTPYFSYLAIPYAQPPINSLRFQPPLPPKPWTNPHHSSDYPPGCVQWEPVTLSITTGQEDCLKLNVFASQTSPSKLKPVLVYIYGGAFIQGASSYYRETYLMDHPIILVTFNYRMGPLGFLNFQHWNSTDPHRYPRGNQGLKDQLLALQWVSKNIIHFGGDPQKITLMGDSAGAASLHLHMLSSKSRGLFQRAILISGSALSSWGWSKYAQRTALEYGQRLDCPTDNFDNLLECYLSMEPHKLVRQQLVWGEPLLPKDIFGPSLEAPHHPDSFLTQEPHKIMKETAALKEFPLLAGVTSGEGILRSGRFRAMPELNSDLDWYWTSPQGLSRVLFLDDPLPPKMAQELKQFYFPPEGHLNFSENPEQFFNGLTQLIGDALFTEPVQRAILSHAKKGRNPTYLFYYDYKPDFMPAALTIFGLAKPEDNLVVRWTKIFRTLLMDLVNGERHKFGVGHGENCLQFWNMVIVPIPLPTKWFMTQEDRQFSQDFVKVFVDFASGEKILTFRGAQWPEINPALEKGEDLPYLKMDNEEKAKIITEPFKKRMQFWTELRAKYSIEV